GLGAKRETQLVVAHDGYGVVWIEERKRGPHVFFARLSHAGRQEGTRPLDGGDPDDLALRDPDDRAPRDADGRVPRDSDADKRSPRIAVTSSGYAVAWVELLSDALGTLNIWMVHLTAAGEPIGKPRRVVHSEGGSVNHLDVVGNGSELWLSWTEADP